MALIIKMYSDFQLGFLSFLMKAASSDQVYPDFNFLLTNGNNKQTHFHRTN